MDSMGTQLLAAALLVVVVSYVPAFYKSIINNIKLSSIPTVGSSGLLTSYIGALRFLSHGKEIMQEGYDKHRGSVFKIPTLTHWLIVASGADKVEDMRRAADDHLSFRQATKEFLRVDLTFGKEAANDRFMVGIVRSQLTRNIGHKFSVVKEEMTAAFSDLVPAKSDEWFKFVAFPTIMDIVCRASNRMLVGLPLCRNPDYLESTKQFTVDIVRAGYLTTLVPSFLKSIAVRFTKVAADIERTMGHLEPLVKERLELEARYGEDWPEKPNDMLSWLFEASGKEKRTLRSMAMNILSTNFASIHSTTVTVTSALYDLVAHPEYVQPLREEIEGIIKTEGWSKGSISKFDKLDSFVKESMRLSPLSLFTILRKVMKDFTFSDGTTIPAGNIICVPTVCTHSDPDIYDDPDTFDGFRFEKMRKQEGEGTKHTLVSLESDYLLFGQGRSACPGRFFAANEVKAMLAYILLNYDFKMANGGGRPPNLELGRSTLPDPRAEILFRRRV